MSTLDDMRARLGLGGSTQAMEAMRSRFRFKPPLPGSVRQDDVLKEKKKPPAEQLLDLGSKIAAPYLYSDQQVRKGDKLEKVTRENPLAAVGKEMVRNVAGAALSPIPVAMHPVRAALNVPLETADATMSLAELATPLDAGNFPGHRKVAGWLHSNREAIADSAMFKQQGQWANAIPTLAGFEVPLLGATKLPALARASKAEGSVVGGFRALRGAKIAEHGRAIIADVEKPVLLESAGVHLLFPAAKKALAWIDDTAQAPTKYLRDTADALSNARRVDVANWRRLNIDQRRDLVRYAALDESLNPLHQKLAASVADTSFASPAKAAAERLVRGPIEKAMEYVRGLKDKWVSRPGTKSRLAARYKDPKVKSFLKSKVPEIREQHIAVHRALSAELEDFNLKVIGRIDAEARGIPSEADKIRKAAFGYATGDKSGVVSSDLKKLIDDAVDVLGTRTREAAMSGTFSPSEVQRIRRGGLSRLITVFRSAHDPLYLNDARTYTAWKKVKDIVRKANPGASEMEIEGSLELMASQEMARIYEVEGRLSPRLNKNPLLKKARGVLLSREKTAVGAQLNEGLPEGMKWVDAPSNREVLESFLGKVEDFPTAYELAGEVLARHSAEVRVNRHLLDQMRRLGLAFDNQLAGHANIRKLINASRDVYVPHVMEEVFVEAGKVSRDYNDFMRAITKTGAMWRAGSTAYSPVTTVKNTLSNTGAAVASGEALRFGFLPALKHAASQAGSVLRRGGQARADREYEVAMQARGLGVGTMAGELRASRTELHGDLPRIRGSAGVPRWMQRFTKNPSPVDAAQAAEDVFKSKYEIREERIRMGLGKVRRGAKFMRDAFEQGDVAPKRAVSSLIAHDFDQMLNAVANSPDELARFKDVYGSINAGEIAADMTSNQLQSYQRVSEGLREIGKGPFIGLFASFPYESARNFQWSFRYLAKETKMAWQTQNPTVRRIMTERAMRRVAGISLNLGFLAEMGDLVANQIGPHMDEEKKTAFNDLVLPEWDRGPVSVIGKEGSVYTYIPGSNFEYFQGPRRLLEHAGKIVSHLANGRFDLVDDAAFDLLVRASDDLLQWQQPLRGVAEALTNQRIPTSPGSLFQQSVRGQKVSTLAHGGTLADNLSDRFTKGLLPGVMPTPLRQAKDIVTGKRTLGAVMPFQIKTVDVLEQMRIAGERYAQEKNRTYNDRISEVNRAETSPQEKAEELSKLRDDWNKDFGPRLARELPQWRKFGNQGQVLDAMKTLGHASATAAIRGQVPRFEQVFGNSIPGRVKFYMRRSR